MSDSSGSSRKNLLRRSDRRKVSRTTDYQTSFQTDPELIDLLVPLYEQSFPGISRAIKKNKGYGINWEDASTPFVLFEKKKPIGHVGVLELPLVIGGKERKVGGLHAVCTHPAYREKGIATRLIHEAIRFAQAKYETVLLFTSNPKFYERFGFRVLQEYRFKAKIQREMSSYSTLRPLNMNDSKDTYILKRLLESRTPVSKILGVGREKNIFYFNEASRPLFYSDSLNVIVSLEHEGSELHLYDVVGPRIPPFSQLLSQIPRTVSQIFFYFNPDRLQIDRAQPEPHIVDGDSIMMVCGPFEVEHKPFMLPRSSRF